MNNNPNDFKDFEIAWDNLMNEIYKSFKIPQIVEWMAKMIDKIT